jgi:membrane protein DedA with SNARE-associated domain
MSNIIIDIIEKFGYIGLFLLIAIENIFPPIPSELILTFGGFTTTISSLTFIGVVISTTLGAIAGALLLYVFGYILNVSTIENIFKSKIGKRLHLKVDNLNKANNWFIKYGNKAVFFGRFIPIVRSLVSIPAGMAKMKFKTFLLLTTSGTLIWNIILVYLGILAGNNWNKVVEYFGIYSKLTLIIIVILGLFLILRYIYFRMRKTID